MRTSWKIATAATIFAVMLSLSSGADGKILAAGQAITTLNGEQAVTLKEQARIWAAELSKSPDGAFEVWKGAWISTAPLGPGTHSWIVLLKRGHNVVGYMIVNAKDDGGFVLGEYGIGEYPPYSAEMLKSALERLGLSQASLKSTVMYVHPLQAAWQLTGVPVGSGANATIYTDAYSGQELPVDGEGWTHSAEAIENANKHGLQPTHASIASAGSMTSFDPYGRLPWLTKNPYSIASNPLASISTIIKERNELRYVSETYKGIMTYAYAVTGYTEWSNGELFISLDSEENAPIRRYIPLSLLQAAGAFYR